MYIYLDGKLVQAEEIKFMVNKFNNVVYVIFSNGVSALLRVVNGQICVTNPNQNNDTIVQISNN